MLAFGIGWECGILLGQFRRVLDRPPELRLGRLWLPGGIRHRGGVWGWDIFGRDGLEENQIMDSTYFWLGACLLVWFLVWLNHDFPHQVVFVLCG